MTIEAAIGTMLVDVDEYTFLGGEVINIVPRRRTYLDQRVPEFGFTNRTMIEAIALFERMFDPDAPVVHPTGWVGSFLSSPDEDTAERLRVDGEVRERRFSVHIRSASARDVLNAICLAHGDLSWEVVYTGEPLDFAHSRVGLAGPTTEPIHAR